MPEGSGRGTGREARWIDAILSRQLPHGLHLPARFGIAGAAATIFYFAIVNALVLAGSMPPVTASIAAYLLSLTLSYLLQSRFAFRSAGDSVRQIGRFVATALAGLALSYAGMALASEMLGLSHVVGALIVCVIIPVANYFIFRSWVFTDALQPPRSVEQETAE